MRVEFQQSDEKSQVIYGQTFAAMLREQLFHQQQVIWCGNQRYYDRYADKFAQLIAPDNSQDWLITPNERYCNRIDQLLDFARSQLRFSPQQKTLYIGLGNEGIMELATFLQHVSPLDSQLWLIPMSLRALAQSLTFDATIVEPVTQKTVLQVTSAPQRILFDHTLADQQTDGKLVDLLTLISCGVVAAPDFLSELYRSYPNQQQLLNQSFAAFIAPLLAYYEAQGREIRAFGQLFEQAFFATSNGHLLSDSMKRMFGLVFTLAWSAEVSELDFNFKNFVVWLYHLGYPLALPAAISTAEYGQQVIAFAQKKPPRPLKKIGQLDLPQVPTERELAAVFDTYHQLVEKIRGK